MSRNNRIPTMTYEQGAENAPTDLLLESMLHLQEAMDAYAAQLREENEAYLKLQRSNSAEAEILLEQARQQYFQNPRLDRESIRKLQIECNQRLSSDITTLMYAVKEETRQIPPEEMLELAADITSKILNPETNQTIKIQKKDGKDIGAEELVSSLLFKQEDISQYVFGGIKIADFFTRELNVSEIRKFIEGYQYDFNNGYSFEGFFHQIPFILLILDYGASGDSDLAIVKNARTFQTWVLDQFITPNADIKPLHKDLIKLLKSASPDYGIKVGEVISRNLNRFGIQSSELVSLLLDSLDMDLNLNQPGRKDRSPVFAMYRGVLADLIKRKNYKSPMTDYAQERLFRQNTPESREILETTLQALAPDLSELWLDIKDIFNHTGAVVAEGSKSPILRSLGISELEISRPVNNQDRALRVYIQYESGHREMFSLQHPRLWEVDSFEEVANKQGIPIHSLYKLTAFVSSLMVDFMHDVALYQAFPDRHRGNEFTRKLRQYMEALTFAEKRGNMHEYTRLIRNRPRQDRVMVDTIALADGLLSTHGYSHHYEMTSRRLPFNFITDDQGRLNPENPTSPIQDSLMRLQISSLEEMAEGDESILMTHIYGIEWRTEYAYQLGIPEEYREVHLGHNAGEAFALAKSKSRLAALEMIINNAA